MANSILKKLIPLVAVFLFYTSATHAGNESNSFQKVEYKGPIYNVFFHPLIAYPKLAFDPRNDRIEYIDSWFVTTREFNKIIPELYKQGFVLFSPKDLFEEKKDNQGQLIIARKKIFLPAGKKPLILSLDDYNFYNAMKLHGTIHKFWVDSNNRLATITNINKHQAIIRYDQEVPQLLEDFISKHPDFSFNNARGIFALTGYNGIFGYNTHQPVALNYPLQLKEAKKVVGKLKEMGWEFGSHSYFHLGLEKQNEQMFEASEKRWMKEVGSIVGTSSYYIFPFGDPWYNDPTRMNFLKSLGYKYFFGVSSSEKITIELGSVIIKRHPIDGLSLRNQYNYGKGFVTFSNVLDVDRPIKINHH